MYGMFGRHLIALPNFSADKAIAVLEKYPMISEYVSAVGASKSTMEVTDLPIVQCVNEC